jgi:hypothetical protein
MASRRKDNTVSTLYAPNCPQLTGYVDIKVVKAFESALALLAET